MCTHPTGKPFHRNWLVLLVVAMFVCPLGCSKEKAKALANSAVAGAKSAVKKAQDYGTKAVPAAKNILPASGSITLTMSPAIEPTAAANVEVITIGDGRANVLQIASYNTAATPTAYPSLLIRGKTQVADAASLAGTTVPCELFLRSSPSAPVVTTQVGTPVQVKFGSFDPQNKTLSATIGSSQLIASDNSPAAVTSGTIVAVISSGGSGT